MKRKIFTLAFAILALTLGGCHRMIGKTILDTAFDVEYDSQIDKFETKLLIDLGDLDGDSVESRYYDIDDSGHSTSVEYIDFEGKRDEIETQLNDCEYWLQLPLDEKTTGVLDDSNVNIVLKYTEIENGKYTVCGAETAEKDTDFNRDNIELWKNVVIGIWDAESEMLYYIEILK